MGEEPVSKRMRGCSEPLTEWRVVLKKAFEALCVAVMSSLGEERAVPWESFSATALLDILDTCARNSKNTTNYDFCDIMDRMRHDLERLAPLLENTMALLESHEFPAAVRVKRTGKEVKVWTVDDGTEPKTLPFSSESMCKFVTFAWNCNFLPLNIVWPHFRATGEEPASALDVVAGFDAGTSLREEVELEWTKSVNQFLRMVVDQIQMTSAKRPLDVMKLPAAAIATIKGTSDGEIRILADGVEAVKASAVEWSPPKSANCLEISTTAVVDLEIVLNE